MSTICEAVTKSGYTCKNYSLISLEGVKTPFCKVHTNIAPSLVSLKPAVSVRRYKCVFYGGAGCGKSTYAKKLIGQQDTRYDNRAYFPTIGSDVHAYRFNENVEFCIWDIGGNTSLNNEGMNLWYCVGADCAIVFVGPNFAADNNKKTAIKFRNTLRICEDTKEKAYENIQRSTGRLSKIPIIFVSLGFLDSKSADVCKVDCFVDPNDNFNLRKPFEILLSRL